MLALFAQTAGLSLLIQLWRRMFNADLGYGHGLGHYPAGIYLLKVNDRNTRTRCEICSKLTIKTPERRHWRQFSKSLKHSARSKG